MSSGSTSSPTVSPRTAGFTSVLHEIHEEFRTLKQQMAEMLVRQEHLQNRRYSSQEDSSGSDDNIRGVIAFLKILLFERIDWTVSCLELL
ncbi:hypothetical protein Lal_00043735 [Lupinus albus]|nr:hypothetical protein Lal_00043735 [Lupinus albus]